MQDDRDIAEGSEIWVVADALTAGRSIDWDTAAHATPSAHQSLMQELTLIAKVFAAHEDRQPTPHESGGKPAAADREPHGEAWGPLVILDKIGEGAFGDVYRAREPRLDRQVALKFFRPHRLSPSQLTSEVIEEGRLLARVHHPNVVTVHGAEHLDDRFGIWMEFVEGSTLEEIVADRGPLSADEAMMIGRDLCRALTALHAAGVLHRDIKARNVMREEGGRVVLMDLGISCEIDRDVPIRQYGTPLYAAPEMLLAGESSRQGDIYSLGVLLYFLVSGQYPITGSTVADIHAAHEAGEIDSLAAVRPDLPAAFSHIVDKALAVNRDERFASAAELEQALTGALGAADIDGLESVAGAERIRRQARSHTDDQQAYNRYLQGRHFWNRRARGGVPKAIEFFRQAVARDPDFALAHVGIADCLNQLSYHQYMRPREGFPEARSTAERALAIDPGVGEAHASLGWICTVHDWDFAAAEREFRRAIHLCPRYAHAREWFALMLSADCRTDEALEVTRACRELDPASLVNAVEAVVLSHAGRYEEAIRIFRLGLETDPDSLLHNSHLGSALWYVGEAEEAEACLRRAIRFSNGEHTYTVGQLAFVLALSKREDEALELIAHLESLSRKRYVSFFHRLLPWIALDRYDKWGPLLENAIEERDPILIWMRSLGARWMRTVGARDSVLSDPRFAEPVRRAGLLD